MAKNSKAEHKTNSSESRNAKSQKKNTPRTKPKSPKADQIVGADILKPLQDPITESFDVRSFTTALKAVQPGFADFINAVSLRSTPRNKWFVEIAVVPEVLDLMQTALVSANISDENAKVVSCNRLNYFSPEVVHAKTLRNGRIENIGSCGAFVKHGGNISVLSAGHVFDRANAQMAVALPLNQASMMGSVTHHVPTNIQGTSGLGLIDVGVAQLNNTEPLSNLGINLFKTKIGIPQVHQRVRIFGGTTMMQTGTIASLNACPTINNIQYHGLLQLDILSQPGDSGAAVVNDNDEIIGFVIGGDADPANRRAYCGNLDANRNALPGGFGNKLYLHGTKSGAIPRAPGGSNAINRRREVELWLHRGTLTKVASKGSYGEIMVACAGRRSEEIQVLTHFEHSFENKDGGKSLEGKKVYFFAIPVEYVAKGDEMIGLSNAAPLLAVNVTRRRHSMATLAGFHRVTPCGGGSTKFADLSTSRFPALSPIASHVVYPAARRRRRAPRESPNPNQAFINYIINDYGQLILVKSKGNPIAPFEKIIGQGKPIHRCSPSGVQDIANERLYYGGWIPDPNWQWE